MDFVLKILLAYLLGSIVGSLVVGRLRGGVDIRTQGSGNAGGTNALRTQGLAFGQDGALYVVEALAGASGLYRVEVGSTEPPQLVLSGSGLVGVAFDPLGGLVVTSNDVAWRLDSLTAEG